MTDQTTIPGEFTRMEISKTNPIETAHKALIVALGKMLVDRKVPKLNVCPTAAEFRDVKEYVADVAKAADAWLQAVGSEARSNAIARFDEGVFQTAFTDAVVGYSLYELESEAEEIDANSEEIDRDTRQAIAYGRTMDNIIQTILRGR
jgi:hypothetical protein